MVVSRRMALLLASAVMSFCALSGHASAMLLGPPPSYAIPTDDGQHIFVMLSPVPIGKDRGDSCRLPNGQQVKLRSMFPASGLYKIGSTRPLWTVSWYGYKAWVHLSPKGRWLVRVNRFGDGGYPRNKSLDWGIRFYDSGKQIKNHHVRDLVDYPSLMSWTDSGYHLMWVHDRENPELRNGFFWLKTSTRATFRFDITTGKIVEEQRFWRHVARISIAMLIVVGLVLLYVVYHRHRRATWNY